MYTPGCIGKCWDNDFLRFSLFNLQRIITCSKLLSHYPGSTCSFSNTDLWVSSQSSITSFFVSPDLHNENPFPPPLY